MGFFFSPFDDLYLIVCQNIKSFKGHANMKFLTHFPTTITRGKYSEK